MPFFRSRFPRYRFSNRFRPRFRSFAKARSMYKMGAPLTNYRVHGEANVALPTTAGTNTIYQLLTSQDDPTTNVTGSLAAGTGSGGDCQCPTMSKLAWLRGMFTIAGVAGNRFTWAIMMNPRGQSAIAPDATAVFDTPNTDEGFTIHKNCLIAGRCRIPSDVTHVDCFVGGYTRKAIKRLPALKSDEDAIELWVEAHDVNTANIVMHDFRFGVRQL